MMNKTEDRLQEILVSNYNLKKENDDYMKMKERIENHLHGLTTVVNQQNDEIEKLHQVIRSLKAAAAAATAASSSPSPPPTTHHHHGGGDISSSSPSSFAEGAKKGFISLFRNANSDSKMINPKPDPPSFSSADHISHNNNNNSDHTSSPSSLGSVLNLKGSEIEDLLANLVCYSKPPTDWNRIIEVYFLSLLSLYLPLPLLYYTSTTHYHITTGSR